MRAWAFLLATVLFCAAQQEEKPALEVLQTRAQAGDSSPQVGPATDRSTDTLRLKVVSVKDPMVDNDEAFRLLLPTEWQREGGIVWRFDLSNLASANIRFFDPESKLALQLFPLMPYTWAEGGIAFFPEGRIYLGNEVRPPAASASDYVSRYLVPAFRGRFDVRVSKRTDLPDVAQAVWQTSQEPGLRKRVSAECVRLEYEVNSQAMEEDVFCVIVYATGDLLPGSTFWGPQRLYSFQAPKGQLDARRPLFQSMVNSVRINPVWFGKYLEVVALWQKGQMQAIRQAGELSRYIAKTNDEIRELHRQAYENQQASQDRVNANFSKALRGVEAYHDPVQDQRIELPSGYDDAWVSGNGEYILSNDANFNPNVGDTQNWQRMRTTQ